MQATQAHQLAEQAALQQSHPLAVFLRSLLPWNTIGAGPAPQVVGDYVMDSEDEEFWADGDED